MSIDGRLLGLGAAAAIVLGTVGFRGWLGRRTYPPGPKPLPLIGNILDMPRSKKTETFEQWYRRYGDVVHIELLGQHMIFLNTAQAVTDLFEHRSANYSSRPQSVLICDLVGHAEWNFVVQEYGEQWRQGRRLFHSVISTTIVPKYSAAQLRTTRKFLKRLKEGPDSLHDAVRRHVGYTILDVTYGIENEATDGLVDLAEEGLTMFSKIARPGAFMVDIIPILRYLPTWFPGTRFHKVAKRVRDITEEIKHAPVREVMKAMKTGDAKPSMFTQLLETASESDAVDAASISYGGGSDTTVSVLLTFFLAMCHYPEVQAKAQAEIDSVVGTDRFPEFIDRDNLVYVSALIMEVLRWQPVGPLGFPRSTMADDEYNGYFIPKGAIVMGNVWSIMNDPKVYPEPRLFCPERFLKKTQSGNLTINEDVQDPRALGIFGYGRRACPGRHLVEQSLFAAVASVLSAFSVKPLLDEMGQPLLPKIEMQGDLVEHPVPFKCNVTPRSARAIELIDGPLPERGL